MTKIYFFSIDLQPRSGTAIIISANKNSVK